MILVHQTLQLQPDICPPVFFITLSKLIVHSGKGRSCWEEIKEVSMFSQTNQSQVLHGKVTNFIIRVLWCVLKQVVHLSMIWFAISQVQRSCQWWRQCGSAGICSHLIPYIDISPCTQPHNWLISSLHAHLWDSLWVPCPFWALTWLFGDSHPVQRQQRTSVYILRLTPPSMRICIWLWSGDEQFWWSLDARKQGHAWQ